MWLTQNCKWWDVKTSKKTGFELRYQLHVFQISRLNIFMIFKMIHPIVLNCLSGIESKKLLPEFYSKRYDLRCNWSLDNEDGGSKEPAPIMSN